MRVDFFPFFYYAFILGRTNLFPYGKKFHLFENKYWNKIQNFTNDSKKIFFFTLSKHFDRCQPNAPCQSMCHPQRFCDVGGGDKEWNGLNYTKGKYGLIQKNKNDHSQTVKSKQEKDVKKLQGTNLNGEK